LCRFREYRTTAEVLSDIGAEAADADIAKVNETEVITGDWDIGDGGIEVENGTTPPACTAGQLFVDTNATSGQQLMACESTTFVVQGDGTGGSPAADSIGTNEIDDGADTPLSGEYIRVDTVDQAGIEYRTTAEVLSDIGAEGTLTNEAGLYSALSDVSNFLQTGDVLAGDDITDASIDATEMASDSINLDELDDGADSPVAGEALFVATGATDVEYKFITESFCMAISDETAAITTGTAKLTMRMPYAFTLTEVRGSLNTVSSSGAPIFDIHESGTTIMTTDKILIDVSEKTSETAATAPTITDTALADDAEITFDIDTAGTGAKGAKICMIGHQ